MKIDEKIQGVQNKLINLLTETSSSKEYIIQILENMGLDTEMAVKLTEAFIQAENAKNKVKNVWDSNSTIDYPTNVAEYQQQETETRQYFDSILQDSILLIVANTAAPIEINEELLQKLHEQDIAEEEITSPALRITFHYYIKSKENEKEKDMETEKMRQFTTKVGTHVTVLKERALAIKAENESLKKENNSLKSENVSLRSSYNYLQDKYKTRILSDEKHYQLALGIIKSLKKEIRDLQNRGVFQTFIAKLFANTKNQLPEPTEEIPNSLYESLTEKIVTTTHDERGLDTEKEVNQGRNSKRTSDSEEIQQ